MSTATGVLRHSRSDAVLVALSLVHSCLLVTVPSSPLIAIGLWWNANTVSHNFVHLPFFHSSALNRLYSLYLTLLLSIPHSIWRQRHLQHHIGREGSVRWTRAELAETGMIAALWFGLVWADPRFFATEYLPGYLTGLLLCHLHGHFEHARGMTTSHYGRIYNIVFFNDGYHVEHHRRSSVHWTMLPTHPDSSAFRSPWPPVLRWVESILDSLEQLVLRSRWLQCYVVSCHERAFRALVPRAPAIRRVTIVGGGLFPRTALVLQRVLPTASLTIVDGNARNLEVARKFVKGPIDFRHESYRLPPALNSEETDLVVIPLAFIGDRHRIYRDPPAPRVLVHDWIWRRRPEGVIVSWFLLKRLNLVTR
jgi:hypothetical protein